MEPQTAEGSFPVYCTLFLGFVSGSDSAEQASNRGGLDSKAHIPGTERLLDAERCHDSATSSIAPIPIPRPSNDPCDPLVRLCSL